MEEGTRTVTRRVLFITASLSIVFVSSAPAAIRGGANPAPFLSLPETAKETGLAGAMTAVSGELPASNVNPASLAGLSHGEASLSFFRGALEERVGHFSVGVPSRRGAFGAGISFVDSGAFELRENGVSRSAVGRRDLKAKMLYSFTAGGVSFGLAGKYISSELLESARATAWLGDAGVLMPVRSRWAVGAAVQNVGGELKFERDGDPLPRTGRLGVAYHRPLGEGALRVTGDGVYAANEAAWSPAVGAEWRWLLLSIRAGYNGSGTDREFSAGMGFQIGSSLLDYSVGLGSELSDRHQMTLSFRFGTGVAPRALPVQPVSRYRLGGAPARPAQRAARRGARDASPASMKTGRTVYTVRPGDSLSRIARRAYGNPKMWTAIYQANRHLIDRPEDISVGHKIILP